MFAIRLRCLLAFAMLTVVALSSVRAQEKLEMDAISKAKWKILAEKAEEEYRTFFQRPWETPNKTFAYWAAINFEMDLGKFGFAALHLKRMLGKDPNPPKDFKEDPPEDVDKELVKLEAVKGLSAFLRLKQVKQWHDHPPLQKDAEKDVEDLIERVTKAVEKHLSAPERIQKFMRQLNAVTEEERAFAFVQIARSNQRAVPYLIEGLRVEHGKPLFGRYREMLLRMDPETVPVYLETFKPANDKDARDLELRLTLLDIVERRDDKRVIPYLWHLSSAKQFPEAIRKRSKEVLARLLKVNENDLAPAKQELTRMAETYYQRKVPFMEGRPIQLWPWDGEAVSLQPVELTPSQAEEFYGLRYARQALDIDPGYQPAQVVLLSLMLERQYRGEVDQLLVKPPPPKLRELLTTMDVNLVVRAMERGMDDRQIPVILPLMQALGERAEYRAARLSPGGAPMGVTRGLYYPDRRVQFAAMYAMLSMPPSTIPAVASDRVVDLARRFLAAGTTPKALAVFAPEGQDAAVRQTLMELGYETVNARTANDAVKKGKRSADFDLVVLHRGMNPVDFAFNYGLLRKDADVAGLPMLVIVDKDREKAIRKFTARDANVVVLVEDQFKADEELKDLVDKHVKKVEFAKLSKEERKIFASIAMDTLWRMSRSELKGYDVTPALDAILDQLPTPEYAVMALEILGRQPGKQIQYRLAAIVTEPMHGKLRVPATIELNRHIGANGLQLDPKQLANLRVAHQDAIADVALRNQLTVTMSMIARPTSLQTGKDLFKFRPDEPPPPKEEKKDEK